jgi:tRNA(Ile2) C34 agmatinyltransferase TiaS
MVVGGVIALVPGWQKVGAVVAGVGAAVYIGARIVEECIVSQLSVESQRYVRLMAIKFQPEKRKRPECPVCHGPLHQEGRGEYVCRRCQDRIDQGQ